MCVNFPIPINTKFYSRRNSNVKLWPPFRPLHRWVVGGGGRVDLEVENGTNQNSTTFLFDFDTRYSDNTPRGRQTERSQYAAYAMHRGPRNGICLTLGT